MSRDTWHKSHSPFVTKSCSGIARVKKALADCRVHLIDGESEAAGVRRPAWGPSGESTPGQPQAQVPPFPGCFSSRSVLGCLPGVELGRRAARRARACCPHVAAAGAAGRARVTRGGGAPWCQARGRREGHGQREDGP